MTGGSYRLEQDSTIGNSPRLRQVERTFTENVMHVNFIQQYSIFQLIKQREANTMGSS